MTDSPTPAPLVRISGWGSEMQLVAATDVAQGALLTAEYPIAFVEIRPDEDDDGPWLLLESILASEEIFARISAENLKMTKWRLGTRDVARIDALARRYRRNPEKLAQFYHRVAANNIRYSLDGLLGYGIWPMVSRSNHSCAPNARLGASASRPLAELLLATRPITRGEAICWNYLADEAFLALDWFGRNRQLLKDFQFLCRCPRCEAERPAQTRALSKDQLATLLEAPPA